MRHERQYPRARRLVLPCTALIAAGLTACVMTPAVAGVAGHDRAAGHPRTVNVPFSVWGKEAKVPGAGSTDAPATANDNGGLFVAFTQSSGGIGYTTLSGTTWSPIGSVTGKKVSPDTTLAPAVTVYKSDPYVFWANTSGQVKYSWLSGGVWQPTQTVSGSWGKAAATSHPAAAVAQGTLYVAWTNTTSIYYSKLTSSGWAAQAVAVPSVTSGAPAIVPTGITAKPLVLAWTNSSNQIGYGVLTSTGFSVPGTVPQAGTNSSPALALMTATPGGTLYIDWKGTHTNKIWYTKITDVTASTLGTSAWANEASLPSSYQTSTGPGLAAISSTLYPVWKGHEFTSFWYDSATTP